jgi:penicillin amidase
LIDALQELENQFGKNIAMWQWGELHTITFEHLFSGVSMFIDPLINIGPYSISGDGTTVFLTEYSLNKPYKTALGPSMRFIYDFASPDEINFILPTGQSGHIMSDHYSDMTNYWLNGKYIKLNLNLDSIKVSSSFQLSLTP